MSKHKKQKRDREVINSEQVKVKDKENENEAIKPEQNNLASLLNNIDMSQLSDFMSSLGINNKEEDTGSSVAAGIGNAVGNGIGTGVNDRRLEVMSALRPMLDTDKVQILDTIIQLYGISKILKKK
jgi:hypothetical protein